MSWYKQTLKDVYDVLESSAVGLSSEQAANRLRTHGLNQLEIKGDSIWKIILEPFRDVFVLVLIIAAIVSLMSHELVDMVVILAVVIINATIYYAQQYATSRILRSLKSHNITEVAVLRDGVETKISSIELVPGDVIILSEGDRIAADARLINVDDLQIDEASLTGESTPIRKHSSILSTDKQIYEQDNMVFQGTYVLSGAARAIVTETGVRTEFGKIAHLASDKKTKSPVQEKVDKIVALIIKYIVVMSVLVFVLSILRGSEPSEALRFVLSLSVSAVPEGLPVAITVIIILGISRMAKKQALVRNFNAIEDVGLITTIATDKTGTLTKNILTVVDDWSLGDLKVGDIANLTLDDGAALSDPLNKAIAKKYKPNQAVKPDDFYPFDIKLRMSGTFYADKVGGYLYIKGSPESILEKSSLSSDEIYQCESMMHKMTSKGHRVIAFARLKINGSPPKDLSSINDKKFEFIGYIAFADELRPEAKSAIEAAKAAGISVRLITGDHYETAYNISKQIGVAERPSQVIQGFELPKDDEELSIVIKEKTVFARILPEDKFRILNALKRSEITAMTGDGVNDVPALSNAHVGFAMGSGSDIAKDAGGIVMLDDNFATIITAISEGRRIYDNIKRMIFYLLSTSIGEVLTMIAALVLGLPLPVTATQILWINLATDTAMALPLGLEPAERNHMKRPPRKPKAQLLNKHIIFRMILVALSMAISVIIMINWLMQRGESLAYIQTVAFLSLVVSQWANALNSRSETESIIKRLKVPNFSMIIGFIIAIIFQILVMVSPLAKVFDVVPVKLEDILISSVISVGLVLISVELHKFILRRRNITDY